MDNDVLKFVTYKERLEEAEGKMVLAYFDYKENTGSDDVDWFWNDFQDKRKAYVAIKDEVPQDEQSAAE